MPTLSWRSAGNCTSHPASGTVRSRSSAKKHSATTPELVIVARILTRKSQGTVICAPAHGNVNPNRLLLSSQATPASLPSLECFGHLELCQNGTLKLILRVGSGHGGGTVGIRRGKGGASGSPRGPSSVPLWHTTPSSFSPSISNRCVCV